MLRPVAEIGAQSEDVRVVDEPLDVGGHNRRIVLNPILEVIGVLEEVEEGIAGLVRRSGSFCQLR
jgi:hypothetical protein